MKKHLKAFFVYLLLLSCSHSNHEIEALTLSENSFVFTADGGEQQVTVTANTEWRVINKDSWILIEVSAFIGDGTRTITIKAAPNYATNERRATMFVTTLSGIIIKEISLSQVGFIDTPFQVYYILDQIPYKESFDLVGEPRRSDGSFNSPGRFPSSTTDGSSTWKIYGEIKDGMMSLDFPDTKFELTDDYKSFTEGLTMAQISLNKKDNHSTGIFLSKKEKPIDRQVYILYVSDDFSNELVTFKSGWNFIEIYFNPDWIAGSNQPFTLIGLVSQDVEVFLEEGYRWNLANIVCCSPLF